MIEIDEILYRFSKGMSKRKIASSLGVSRNTVKSILLQAKAVGLGGSFDQEELGKIVEEVFVQRKNKTKAIRPIQDYLKSHHEQIVLWLAMPHMTVTQMVRLFKEDNKVVSESSLRRYIDEHFPSFSQSTVHLETRPGEQAQVDFASVGLMKDPLSGEMRKSYAFIMTLSHSRYRFVRFVFKQDVASWIDCHIRAFHFFGGVPRTVMPDNLKSGVETADLYDPILNRSYAELEKHYGFVCDPTKIRTPRHKGKVERSVLIVRQQVLAGRNFNDIEEANAYALRWCRFEVALRPSRTTGQPPFEKFIKEEKSVLLPLPLEDYRCPVWQKAKVHRDHHVVFEGSFYSVPNQYIGQELWIRATDRIVDVYCDQIKVKTHIRCQSRGQWITDQQDYPKKAIAFLEKDKDHCLKQAQEIGPSTYEFLVNVLQSPALLHQRKAQAILRFSEKYGALRLEAACKRALSFDNKAYKSLKKILVQGLEQIEVSQEEERQPLAPQTSYLRKPHEFYSQEVSL